MAWTAWHGQVRIAQDGLKLVDVNIESPAKHIVAVKDEMLCAITRFMLVSMSRAPLQNLLIS